jgi:peptidoglycan/xylan/chitin deacetylase (PgdA/CDA1 family)
MLRRLVTGALSSEAIVARARRRAARSTTVLMYHELLPDDEVVEAWTVVTASTFRRQMEYVRRHYDIVSIDEALARDGGRRPAAVITFDDGGAGNHEHLLPLIDSMELPITVFVATGHVEAGRPYWFDRVMNALQVKEPVQIDLRESGLGTYAVQPASGAHNWVQVQRLLADIKLAGVARNEELADLVERLVPDHGRKPLQPMSVAQVRELAQCRHVTIGAHSHSHSLLTQLAPAQILADIGRCRELLQQWTGKPVRHFAYPSGDHDDTVRELIRATGFATGFTTEEALWVPRCDPHAIPRMGIGRYDDFGKFRLSLSGGAGTLLRSLV